MNAKPWQIAVIVLGLIGGGGYLIYQIATASASPLPHTARLIDVVSGEVFDLNTNRVGQVALPAAHPDTGERTLVRIREVEPGRWVVMERDLAIVREFPKTVQVKAIDPKTGELTAPVGSVRTYKKFAG